MEDIKMNGAEFKAKYGDVFFVKEKELSTSDPIFISYCRNNLRTMDSSSTDMFESAQKQYKKDSRIREPITAANMAKIGFDVPPQVDRLFSIFKDRKEIFPKSKLAELLAYGKGYVTWGTGGDYTLTRVSIPDDAEVTIDVLGIRSDRLEYHNDPIFFDDYLTKEEIIGLLGSISYRPEYLFSNLRKSDELILEILKVKGEIIKYVDQTPERCIIAVTQNGENLNFVIDKTDDIEIAACKSRDGNAIAHVRVQTKQLVELFCENNHFPWISYIKNEYLLDLELCTKLITKHPGMIDRIPEKYKTNDMWKISLAQRPDFIHYNKNQNEELVLFAFTTGKLKDKQALAYCHIQTPKIILEAVTLDHDNLAVIKHPRIIYKAPEPDSGRYPTQKVTQEANFESSDIKIEDIIILALDNNGWLIDNVIDPTKEMKILAVKTYSSYRKHGNRNLSHYDTKELCDKFEKEDIIDKFFDFEHELDVEYVKQLIKLRPNYINYMLKSQKYGNLLELKFLAIENGYEPHSYSIYSDDINREELKALLAYKGKRLEHLQKQDEELCLIAVKQNGKALKYVKEQTEAIVLVAVAQNEEAKEFVKPKFWKLFV